MSNGADVFEYNNHFFHTKAYLVDNKYLSLGSFNHDITSFSINNEVNYFVKKNNYNQHLFDDFENLVNKKYQCSLRPVTYQNYKFIK